jgi:hypothetical protein
MGYPDGTKSRTKTTDGDALTFLRVAAKGETRIKTSRQARPKLPANVLLLIPAASAGNHQEWRTAEMKSLEGCRRPRSCTVDIFAEITNDEE